MPQHGELGKRDIVRTTSEEFTTVERWCEECQEWIKPASFIQVIIGSVACVKCNTDWSRPVNNPADKPESNTAKLRLVSWTNIWNRARANDTDGIGTKYHVTISEKPEGKTLCGRSFPADKGSPSTWGAGLCKKCAKKAHEMGEQPGFAKKLEHVPSVQNY